MNKPKAQGTASETSLVNDLTAAGFKAKRIAEGGSKDEGDVEAHINGHRVIIESKACQQLNAQATLSKARKKANGAPGADPAIVEAPVIVAWRRLVRAPGNVRRTPVAGERLTVFLSWDDLMRLLTR